MTNRLSNNRYLMSADSRENCEEWCRQLTTVLNGIRLWGCDAIKPYTAEAFENLMTSMD